MNNQKMVKKIGISLLIIGAISFCFGLSQGESDFVSQKSNMICLECIGIG